MEYNGIEMQKIVRGFKHACYSEMRDLREHVEKLKDKDIVKNAPIYIDIIYKIDELLKK